MDETQKQQVKAVVHGTAGKVAVKANGQGKAASGWRRWLWGALAVLAGAVAWFTAGCTATVSQAADGSWTYTGIIVLPVEKGGK